MFCIWFSALDVLAGVYTVNTACFPAPQDSSISSTSSAENHMQNILSTSSKDGQNDARNMLS